MQARFAASRGIKRPGTRTSPSAGLGISPSVSLKCSGPSFDFGVSASRICRLHAMAILVSSLYCGHHAAGRANLLYLIRTPFIFPVPHVQRLREPCAVERLSRYVQRDQAPGCLAQSLEPRDDIWPTDVAPIVRRAEGGVEIAQMRWGFPPARP